MKKVSIAHGAPLEEVTPECRLTTAAFLIAKANAYAEREVLVFWNGDERVSWTYRRLLEEAEAVAKALVASGMDRDARIGLLMTNRPEWVATFFGIGLAGGIAVPLSTFSTSVELAYLIETSGLSAIVMESRVANNDLISSLLTAEPAIGSLEHGKRSLRFPFLRHVVVLGDQAASLKVPTYSDFLDRGVAVSSKLVYGRAAAIAGSDVGGIFFSSGSTSAPKGVINSHRGMVLQFQRQADLLELSDEQTVRGWGPNGFFWSGNCAQVLGATMAVGGTLVLQARFDPEKAIDLMSRERVTYPQAWPHQWAQLEAASNWLTTDLSALHFFDIGKVVTVNPTIATEWKEPRWCYGSTETFTVSTGFPACSSYDVAKDSHGVPLPGNTVKIVDPHTGAIVPIGELGEIAVKGPTLMLGYLGTPASESLDPDGFFRTGDSGHLDDCGRLFWEGRLSDIIKSGGANVSPLEIDEALARHSAIKASKTVGVPHPKLGEMVVSCIVLHDDSKAEEAELIAYLKDRLSGYKVPRRILTFEEGDLSYTGSSKIKTNALRDRARAMLEE